MHKGDTIPGLITALFGFSVAIYTLVEDTMRWNAQSSDGVPGAGFFPVLLGFVVGILGVALTVRGLYQKGSVQYFKLDPEIKKNLKTLALAVVGIVVFFILWQTTKQFILCVPILCFYLNVIFGRNLKYNLIYTVVFTAFLYLAFVKGFSVQFNM